MTNKKRGGKKHKKPNSTLPFVSICTPTFNRRPFITHMIKCFEHQDYPKNRMEWIIIDDGTDKIEELVTHIPQVKYFKYDKKMSLGEKRNLMHTKTCGEILNLPLLKKHKERSETKKAECGCFHPLDFLAPL